MNRSSTLDVLKGVCILLVIFTHLAWTESEILNMYATLWVELAVPIFMLTTGFLYAKSFKNKKCMSLSEIYTSAKGGQIVKILRYSVPYFIAWIIELIIMHLLHMREFPGPAMLLKEFLSGGVGPGSYYYPVLIQLVFLFPLIYIIVLKYEVRGLAVCCGANVFFELLQWAYGMNEATYRLLVFRYTMLIAFGCYFGLGGKMKWPASVVMFITGLIGGYLNTYCDITPFFITYWKTTSFLTALHAVPIFYYVKDLNLRFKPMELLGKASYHIYLVQMVFFVGAGYIYSKFENRILGFLMCIVICLVAGVAFYCVEKPISKLYVAFGNRISDRLLPKDDNRDFVSS